MDNTGLLQEQVFGDRTSFLQGFVSRVRRLPRQTLIGAGIAAGIAITALLAPILAPYSPDATNLLSSFKAPSFAHPMGTDFVGRDVFSRVLYGTRSDLFVVVLVTYAGLTLGVLVGTIAAYFGGWADNLIGRLADTAIAFPFIVIVLAVVAVVGVGLWGVAVGIVAVGWALYARLARTEMLSLREHEFMLATKALGYTHKRAILRHAIPNIVHSSLVYSTIDVVSNLVVLAAMSYLGLGQQPPGADLGSLISGGQPYLLTAWWISTLPGLVLVVLGVGIGLIGDGLTGGDVEAVAL